MLLIVVVSVVDITEGEEEEAAVEVIVEVIAVTHHVREEMMKKERVMRERRRKVKVNIVLQDVVHSTVATGEVVTIEAMDMALLVVVDQDTTWELMGTVVDHSTGGTMDPLVTMVEDHKETTTVMVVVVVVVVVHTGDGAEVVEEVEEGGISDVGTTAAEKTAITRKTAKMRKVTAVMLVEMLKRAIRLLPTYIVFIERFFQKQLNL